MAITSLKNMNTPLTSAKIIWLTLINFSIGKPQWDRMSICSQDVGLPCSVGNNDVPARDVPVPAQVSRSEA